MADTFTIPSDVETEASEPDSGFAEAIVTVLATTVILFAVSLIVVLTEIG